MNAAFLQVTFQKNTIKNKFNPDPQPTTDEPSAPLEAAAP
jgi:hypothetical protein